MSWVWTSLLGVGAVALLLAGAAFVLYPQVLKRPPAATYPAPRSAAEANLQDLDYLARVMDVDRSFAPEAKAAFSAGIAELESRAATLSPPQLEMQASRLAALADNGHTGVRGVGRGVSLNALPIRIHRFAEGYVVVRARPELADLLGARVTAIGGRTPDALIDALAPFVGGPAPLRREYATYMLVSPQALQAVGLAEGNERATVTMTLASGAVTTRDLAAEPEPANGPERTDPVLERLRRNHWPQRDLSPIPSPVDVGAWATVLDPRGALPLYLANPDRHYWSEAIGALDAVYVQINAVRDEKDGPSLAAFLQGVVTGLHGKPVRNAIVDLRFNSGGDYTLTGNFTKALPDALPPDGRIFVLTGANTFSAGIVTAARLKYFGGHRALIAGEPVGDREQHWGEGGSAFLPNSRLEVRYATALHDWEHGCALSQIRACYVVDYFIGVPAGKLSPNLAVVPRYADYAVGEDTLLLAIAARPATNR